MALTLHRLVYVAALLAVLHFIWLVKADLLEPMVYLGIFSLLMLLRIPRSRKARPFRVMKKRVTA